MFLLKRPSEKLILRFISSQQKKSFSYAEVGASQQAPPAGYKIDHNRICLGAGKNVYERARQSLREWKHFDLGWLNVFPVDAPIQIDSTVAVMASHFGFWSLSACRIVYLIDEEGQGRDSSEMAQVNRSGFAYGTLADHVESGEERFTIEWQLKDDSVWYDILAFSRPNNLLVRIGYPVASRMQRKFARASLAAMVRAVCETK